MRDALFAGQFQTMILTRRYPGGELRGQMMPVMYVLRR